MNQTDSVVAPTNALLEDPGQVFRALAALRSACVLYPDGHPAIATQVKDVHRHALDLLADRETVHLDVIRGTLHLEGEPHPQESRTHARVLEEFAALGIDSVHLSEGLTRDEVRTVGEFIAREHRGPGVGDAVLDELETRGVSHMSVGRILPVNHRVTGSVLPDEPDAIHDADYREATDRVRETFEDLERGLDPDVRGIHEVLQILVGRVARSGVALSQVMALKDYENFSYLHSVNVALLSVRLGERLGFDQTNLLGLAEAALLHDVGKTRIPVEILRKAGRPTDREWRVIRRHPLVGAEILAGLEGLAALTPVVALEHHRDYTGTGGYPDLGADRPPHAMSQLVAVADVYESVTGARSYREPASPDQACLILARMAGEKLNPSIVKAFVSAVTFFPIGSVVRTSRDELGLVTATNEDDALHPSVVLLDEARPDAAVGPVTDLRERDASGGFVRDVVRSIPAAQSEFDVPRLLREAGVSGSI